MVMQPYSAIEDEEHDYAEVDDVLASSATRANAAVEGIYAPPSAEQMVVYDAGDAPGASEERQMQRLEKSKKNKKAPQQGSMYLGFNEDNTESML